MLVKKVTKILITLEGAAWIGFGLGAVLGLVPGLPEGALIRWSMATLAWGAGLALILLYHYSSRSRAAYWLLVGSLALISLLSLTDQLGLVDWISFSINLIALGLLILQRHLERDQAIELDLAGGLSMDERIHPSATDHPWERIYREDGRVFTDQLPALEEAVSRYSAQGCRRILDLGCGNGRHVVALAGLGFEAVGLDISTTGLRLTRQWLEEGGLEADLLQGDTRQAFPLADASLDGVFSTQVIHHALLEEVHQAIGEIHRVLKPGGLAFVTVPHRSRSSRQSQVIEKHTYLPLEGPERGLPHHIFSKRRLKAAFKAFRILGLSYRDNRRLLAIWVQKTT